MNKINRDLKNNIRTFLKRYYEVIAITLENLGEKDDDLENTSLQNRHRKIRKI